MPPDRRLRPPRPGSASRKLTPPQIAAQLGVSPDKVLAWIRSGELRAFNAATCPHGRPRWLIDEVDLLAFERRRAARPGPTPRRRKQAADVIEFL
jgi:excisionase family DNA binding protein